MEEATENEWVCMLYVCMWIKSKMPPKHMLKLHNIGADHKLVDG